MLCDSTEKELVDAGVEADGDTVLVGLQISFLVYTHI